jgi:hypothetical protein
MGWPQRRYCARELGIASIEATVATARTRAFLKAHTRSTFMSDFVGQPSRMRPNAWPYGTMCLHDRFARACAELAPSVRIPHALRSLQPRNASNLGNAAVKDRVETLSSTCSNSPAIIYSHASNAGNPLPQCGTGIPIGTALMLHIMIQLLTREFPLTRYLDHIHAMPLRFLCHCFE